jgi:hypothetical protein
MTLAELRTLNEEGLNRFEQWLLGGAVGALPETLLIDPQTSNPLPVKIRPARRSFRDRFEFGLYLTTLLSPLDVTSILHDRGLWSALALFWFDEICPTIGGHRKLDKEYRYILSGDFRHYYRHLVRSPWYLVREHGINSKFLLLPPVDGPHPLRRHGEILEQLGGRQAVLRSRPIIAEASRLYTDPRTGRPLKGVSGSGKGSVRRLALVLQQFELTFDCDSMQPGNLLKILPSEFDRWKDRHDAASPSAEDASSPHPRDANRPDVLVIEGR